MTNSSSTLASQLIAIYRDTTSTIADLLAAHKDTPAIACNANIKQQVIGHSQKAIRIIESTNIPPTTKIGELILDEDAYIESETIERKLHTALNLARLYANEVQ